MLLSGTQTVRGLQAGPEPSFYFKFSLLTIVGHPNSYLSRRSGRNQMTIPRGTEVVIRIQLDLPGRVIVGQIISKHSER